MPKARGNGEGMIRKRANGTWEARFSFIDGTGKLRTKSFYDKQRGKAREKMQEAQQLYKRGENDFISCDLTLNEWFIFWLATFKKGKVEFSTLNTYSIIFINYIQDDLGKYKIDKITPIQVQQLINSIDTSESTRIVEMLSGLLKECFKVANQFEYTKNNPTLYIQLPQKKKKNSRALNKNEETIFISNLYTLSFYDKLLLYLLLVTGIRRSEALAIMWEDVDFENNLISINKGYKLGILNNEIGKTKTKSSVRFVPINSKLKELLMQADNKSGFIFKGRYPDKPLNIYYPTKLFTEYVKQLEIKNINLHCLRHTFATRCMENGIPQTVTQKWLGHSSVNMTNSIYTHANQDFLREQAMALNNMF